MTMTDCPNMAEMQPFPQQVLVGILVPAGQVPAMNFPAQNFQAMAAPAFYAKPEYLYVPQQLPVPMQESSSHDSLQVTPRSPVRQYSPETADTADTAERPRLSTSAARRMRRKRAAERAALALEQQRAERAPNPKVRSDSISSILEQSERLRQQLASGIADEVQEALATVQGHVWQLSQHATGCRLVQLALDTHMAPLLARELHGHVQEAAVSPHANYVVQKVVSSLTFAASSFVARELLGSCARLARHRYACRIFCRLLEFCGQRDLTLQLIDELLEECEDLCRHNFGHHVVQSVLEHGHERHRKVVADVLKSDLLSFAKHRNASYLVEKALTYCAPQDQHALLAQLGRTEVIVDLARSQFGCYVAKSLLQDERVTGKEALFRIQASSNDFQRTRHGQRLLVEMGLAEDRE
ncbi:unnamed protein product [Effrenium voratum]|uniref:PUM-HD domain-containing protein n=1 Tax=Effrenium voratum TaxID=2562239 RepID=A0AA36N4T1_9DINO|nr:unnamed protein product [Effrenium voratum]